MSLAWKTSVIGVNLAEIREKAEKEIESFFGHPMGYSLNISPGGFDRRASGEIVAYIYEADVEVVRLGADSRGDETRLY